MPREKSICALAGVPYNRFLGEVQARRVVILDDPTFTDRVQGLAERFGNEALQDAAGV